MTSQFEISSATGVDQRFNIAGPGARSYAFVIDWHIRLLLALGWFCLAAYLIAGTLALDFDTDWLAASYGLIWWPALLLYALYHPVLEIVMQGRTPGKRIAGVRIVTQDAQIPGAFAILLRNVLRLIDSLPTGYVIGLLTTVLTQNAVRIGDLAAGTLLVYESNNQQNALDLGNMNQASIHSHGLARVELAEDLLRRWKQLDDPARLDLGERVLAKLSPDTRPSVNSDILRDQIETALATSMASEQS